MSSFFNTRFIINTGKGGVGKTSVSAAIALAYARRGKRVLHMQLSARDRLGAAYGIEPVGPEVVPLTSNVWAVNTNGKDAMREYAMMILRVRTLYKAVFENRVVDRFLRVVPGLPELTMLGKAYFHEKETSDSGRPKWDAVIIDAPATGHGMFLLQIPQVISKAVGSGHMADEARNMLQLLEDPTRTCINLITLPEETPVSETVELHRQLKENFDIRVGFLIANGVFPYLMTAPERSLANQLSLRQTATETTGQLLQTALFRENRCDLQRQALDRLRRELPLPVMEIPFYFEPDPGRPLFERMAASFSDSVARLERT